MKYIAIRISGLDMIDADDNETTKDNYFDLYFLSQKMQVKFRGGVFVYVAANFGFQPILGKL